MSIFDEYGAFKYHIKHSQLLYMFCYPAVKGYHAVSAMLLISKNYEWLLFIMSPISKKLEEHIAFGSSTICPAVHPFITLFLQDILTTVFELGPWNLMSLLGLGSRSPD